MFLNEDGIEIVLELRFRNVPLTRNGYRFAFAWRCVFFDQELYLVVVDVVWRFAAIRLAIHNGHAGSHKAVGLTTHNWPTQESNAVARCPHTSLLSE